MKISFGARNYNLKNERVLYRKKKVDKDEKIVRKMLVKTWTNLLVQYARPGVQMPPLHEIRKILLRQGVEASINAVVDAHWFVYDWMIRDEIEVKVKEGLDSCDLESFIREVQAAQNDPNLFEQLRASIKRAILDGF